MNAKNKNFTWMSQLSCSIYLSVQFKSMRAITYKYQQIYHLILVVAKMLTSPDGILVECPDEYPIKQHFQYLSVSAGDSE
jgi:hypothetical protein